MRILIIGGSGFVGQSLMKLLSTNRDNEIVNIDIEPSDFLGSDVVTNLKNDILDWEPTPEYMNFDAVVCLASRQYMKRIPWWKRREFFSVNPLIAERSASLAKRVGAETFIYFSSDMVYPSNFESQAHTSEKALLSWSSSARPYGASKIIAESNVMQYTDAFSRLFIFRPKLIVGPRRAGVIGALRRLLSMGLPVPILSLRYQMVDVEDVASATALAIRGSEKGVQILNIGAFSISIDDFVRDIKKSSGSKSLLVKIPLRVLVFGALFLDFFNLSPINREQVSFLRKPVEINSSKTAASLNWVPKHIFPRHDDDFRLDAR